MGWGVFFLITNTKKNPHQTQFKVKWESRCGVNYSSKCRMTHESGDSWSENVLNYRGLDPVIQTIEDRAERLPGAFQLQLLVWAEWGLFEISLLIHPKRQRPALYEKCRWSHEALRRAGEFYIVCKKYVGKKIPKFSLWDQMNSSATPKGRVWDTFGMRTVGLWNTLFVKKLPL